MNFGKNKSKELLFECTLWEIQQEMRQGFGLSEQHGASLTWVLKVVTGNLQAHRRRGNGQDSIDDMLCDLG
jgi:hypothetical protein